MKVYSWCAKKTDACDFHADSFGLWPSCGIRMAGIRRAWIRIARMWIRTRMRMMCRMGTVCRMRLMCRMRPMCRMRTMCRMRSWMRTRWPWPWCRHRRARIARIIVDTILIGYIAIVGISARLPLNCLNCIFVHSALADYIFLIWFRCIVFIVVLLNGLRNRRSTAERQSH